MLKDFLERLTQALDLAEVPYMVCGSVASFIHGVPRTTQDVDIVVVLNGFAVPKLIEQLPDTEFYVSESAALDAVMRQSQFNVIDLQTGWKADLIVRKRRPYSREEFGRRQQADVLGVSAWVASAEDTILAKLEWSTKSGSERQLRDVQGVLEVSGSELDWTYLERWATELGVWDQLRRLRND